MAATVTKDRSLRCRALTDTAPMVTVDVEDWPQSTWDRSLPISERAARNTRHVLEILAAADARVTMFVQGKFAETFPDVVREIFQAGHEVGCHGYGHIEVFKLTPDEFREDLHRSKDLLEQIIGEPILGYRAPDFSIIRKSLWALDILAELGFEYDTSIFPIRGRRYGIPDWPLAPADVSLPSGRKIIELPLGTLTLGGKTLPAGGGGYFRLLPGIISRAAARRSLVQRPFVFYCHPYEFDRREMFEIGYGVPLKVRLHQGLGRGSFEKRFIRFITKLGCQPVQNWLNTSKVEHQVDLAATTSSRSTQIVRRDQDIHPQPTRRQKIGMTQ